MKYLKHGLVGAGLIALIMLFFSWFSQPGLGYPSFEIAAKAYWQTGSIFTKELQGGQVEAIKTAKGLIFVYPPLPLLPMLVLAPLKVHEIWLTRILSAISAVLLGTIVWGQTKSRSRAYLLGLLYILTTPILFFSAHEGSWFTAQVFGVVWIQLTFIMYTRKNWSLAGLFTGLAALCRLNLGLVTGSVLLLALLIQKKYREMLIMGIAIAPSVIIFGWWNYFRFGDIFQSGYSLIQGVTTEYWYRFGVMNPRYIPGNLVKFVTQKNVSGDGLGIIWAQPYLLLLPLIAQQNWLLFFIGLLNFMMVLAHGFWGAWQFDFRFLFDSLWAWFPVFAVTKGFRWYLALGLMGIASVVHLVFLPLL